MKSVLGFLGLILIALSILWTFGAVKAGLFGRDGQLFASRVDEDSIDPAVVGHSRACGRLLGSRTERRQLP